MAMNNVPIYGMVFTCSMMGTSEKLFLLNYISSKGNEVHVCILEKWTVHMHSKECMNPFLFSLKTTSRLKKTFSCSIS